MVTKLFLISLITLSLYASNPNEPDSIAIISFEQAEETTENNYEFTQGELIPRSPIRPLGDCSSSLSYKALSFAIQKVTQTPGWIVKTAIREWLSVDSLDQSENEYDFLGALNGWRPIK